MSEPSWLFSYKKDQETPFVEYNHDDATISFSQFPDNPNSLAIIEGHLFDRQAYQAPQSASDAERIIEVYKQYGEDLFTKLRGGFSLVIWDASERRVIAGRDHIGQIPFYYYWDGQTIHISSSMKTLLRQPGVNADVNRITIAEYLLCRYNKHQTTETFFQEIHRLPPSFLLNVNWGELSVQRYWTPLPPDFQWAKEEEISTLTSRFEQAVRRCIEAGADTIALSGGYDSNSIATMASMISKQTDLHAIQAISGGYKDSGADEGEVQKKVSEALSMQLHLNYYDDYLEKGVVLQESLDLSTWSPIPNVNMFESFFLSLTEKAASNNLRGIMFGDGGDELFLADYSWAMDLLTSMKLKSFYSFSRITANYLKDTKPKTLFKLIWLSAIRPLFFQINQKVINYGRELFRSKPSFKKQTFSTWLNETDESLVTALHSRNPSTDQPPNHSHYVQYKNTVTQSPWLMNALEHRYHHCRKIGLTHFYPFFDIDLMNLSLRIHPRNLLENGLIKSPLQKFLQENLGSVQIPSRKTDFSDFPHKLLRKEGQMIWKDLSTYSLLGDFGIIQVDKLNDFMQQYFREENQNWLQAWRIISSEVWLRNYFF